MTVADNFDRVDNTSSLGSTSTGSVPWQALLGTWGINTNRAYVSTVGPGGGQSEAVVECGVADGTVGVTLQTVGDAAGFGLCFRVTDANNHYVFEGASGTRARVYKRVSGTYTLLAQSAGNITYAGGDLLEVVLSGTSITVKRNGASAVALTDSTYTTQTKHGLHVAKTGSAPTTRFDDFSFDPDGVAGEAFASSATFLDGVPITPIVIPGEAFASTATFLDGTPLVAIRINGEPFASAVTMLDGNIGGAPILVDGESWVAAATFLDGSVSQNAGTDVSNRGWARRRGGIGLVIVEVPVAPVPPTRVAAARVTKAVPLPTPTMDDGRPT